MAFSQEVSTGKKEVKKPNSPQSVTTVIKTNPFAMLGGVMWFASEYRLLSEFIVAKNQSVTFGVSYLGKSPITSAMFKAMPGFSGYKITVRGYRVQASHRFYLNNFRNGINNVENNRYAPRGFYVSPHFSIATSKLAILDFAFQDYYIEMVHFNANLLVGCQLIARGGFAIDAFTGLGYKKNSWTEHYMGRQYNYDLSQVS